MEIKRTSLEERRLNKLYKSSLIRRDVLTIFVEAGRLPATRQETFGDNYDLAINPEGRVIKVYKPETPEDNF